MVGYGGPLEDHDDCSGDDENGDGPDGEENGAVAEGADDQCRKRRSRDPGDGNNGAGVDDVGWFGAGVSEVGVEHRASDAGWTAHYDEGNDGDRQRGREGQDEREDQGEYAARQHGQQVVLPTVSVGRYEQRGDEPAGVVDGEDPPDLSGRRVVEGDQDQSEGGTEEGDL
jgi:hypothetical protein